MIEPKVGESFAFQLGGSTYTGLVKAYSKKTGDVTMDHFGHEVIVNIKKKDTIRIRHPKGEK